MVQRYVFNELDDPRLHGIVVWGPMLGGEERSDAEDATRFLNDSRTTHLWTPRHDVAELLAPTVGLPVEERAWDTFLLFPPGATWGEEPPQPVVVQHVNKPLPDDQRLHGPTLLDEVKELLDGEDDGTADPAVDRGGEPEKPTEEEEEETSRQDVVRE